MQQIRMFLEGGRVRADFPVLVGGQNSPGEVNGITVHVRDALHTVPQGDFLKRQGCAGRAVFNPASCLRDCPTRNNIILVNVCR
jgi:hypothetical protein